MKTSVVEVDCVVDSFRNEVRFKRKYRLLSDRNKVENGIKRWSVKL